MPVEDESEYGRNENELKTMPKKNTLAPEGKVQLGYELYVMRHGLAVTRGSVRFSDDAQRPLVPEGKEKMREIAGGLKRMGFEVDWIVTSPLVRAVETGELLPNRWRQVCSWTSAMRCGPAGHPRLCSHFWPNAPTAEGYLWSAMNPTSASWPPGLSAPVAMPTWRLRRGGAA